MSWLKFSVAVVLTSAALVLALFGTGAFVVSNAIAHAAPMQTRAPMAARNLPPELASLEDVPNAEKFAHFQGIQVSLTDKNGNPVAISVTPGLASSVGSDSITVAGNDGANHTYALTDQTWRRGGTQVADGDQVVVVTLNDETSARAVVDLTAMQHQRAHS
jgi:hypothetical protein